MMIEETGIVVAVDDQSAWVETQRQSACSACAVNKACGTATIAKVFGNRRSRVRVESAMPLRVGDRVLLGLQEEAFLKGSLMLYLLPLVLAFALALVADAIARGVGGESELFAVIGALCGLVVAGIAVSRYANHASRRRAYQPVVLKLIR